MIRAIVFDLWNTLAYNNVKVNPVLQVERLLGVKIPKYHEAEKTFMLKEYKSIREASINLCRALKVNPAEDVIKEMVKIWHFAVERFALFPEVRNTLKELKGRYRAGLISNTDCFSVKPIFKRGFDKYFDAVVFSCKAGLLKPDRKIFEIMLDKLGSRPEETLMVGDNLHDDILPAESLGIKCVMMRRKGPYSLSWVEKGSYKNEISSLKEIWKYLE